MAGTDQAISSSESDNDSVTCSKNAGVKRRDINIDFDDEIMHGMTASYTEISFNTQSSEPDDSILEDIRAASSCIQELEVAAGIDNDKKDTVELGTDDCGDTSSSIRPSQLSLERKFNTTESDNPQHKALEYLNQLNGTITQEGDMVLFVAEDLENKIKLSSPVGTKDDTELRVGSLTDWGGPDWLHKHSLMSQLPAIDTSILNDLELEVQSFATSVDSLTENLAETLHSVSALTVDCLETYRDVVCKTCDAVDLNIKSMYQLMAKCEELSKTMRPISKLSQQIKDIKHFLDLFENATN